MQRYVLFALFALLLVLSLSSATGCVEPDLGEAPVFCNLYEPRCPRGYLCVKRGADEVCVREGSAAFDESDGGPAAQPD